jgi:predicted RND superfamily exporter protein
VSSLIDRIADGLTTYTKTIILVAFVMTMAIGAGMGQVEQDSGTGQFESDSPAADAQAYIEENFTIQENGNVETLQMIQRGDNVLTAESLIESLDFQQEIRNTESIEQTFVEDNPVFGVSNVIAFEALQRQAQAQQAGGDGSQQAGSGQQSGESQQAGNASQAGSANGQQQQARPSLDQQKAAIQWAAENDQLQSIIQDVLGEGGDQRAIGLMPASYTLGSTSAEAQGTIVRQQIDQEVQNPNSLPPEITDAQLEIRQMGEDRDSDYSMFGFGLLSQEINQSLGDSGAIVGPFALLFVVLTLTIAYRDLLDIILGVVGIFTVLIWTFGFMGWTGIAFNQLLLSVPVLLIGLSIDYAIHVFMRYREQRTEDETASTRQGMNVALAGVGAALVWVTATGAIGFLANLTSPIGPLRDFGIVAAFGVFGALIIFGTFIPALKIEIDGFLENRGFDRRKRAFGTGGSLFSGVLASGVTAARRVPIVVVVLALLLSVGGAYGATQVDTSFDETDFLADSPPEWTENLPGAMAPGTYEISEDLEYIGDQYQQENNDADVLIQGDVTNEQTLRWLDQASQDAGQLDSVYVGPAGPAIRSPLTVMQQTAGAAQEVQQIPAEQRTDRQQAVLEFARAYQQAAGEDGVPEQNIEQLFDLLLQANPQAAQYVYQADGEYEALRLQFGVDGNAGISEIAEDNRQVATVLEDESGGDLTATAGGSQAVFDNVQEDLLDTVIQGLIITLVSVFLFLAAAYRLTGSSASLGIVTMIPVALSVTWILGSMWVLKIPFNTLTGTITSLTIGLGIAYSIHISSRYELELQRQGDVWDAMYTTVTGTGGALLGSAATTVGGFGTLAFAILPLLRQFGIITGLTIIYAFLASVLVLPSLLVLWTRYLGPSGHFPPHEDSTPGSDSPATEQPADAEDVTSSPD